jgi:hypothetical protein
MRGNAPIEVPEAVIAVATERTTARSEVSYDVLPLKIKKPTPKRRLAFSKLFDSATPPSPMVLVWGLCGKNLKKSAKGYKIS